MRHLIDPVRLMLLLALLLGVPQVAFADDEAPPKPADPPGEEAKPAPEKPAAEKAPIKRRPLLWMVDSNPRVFLYGTIHIPDPRVTKHLPVVQAALDQSTALYTELELDMAGQAKAQQEVMAVAMLPADKSLKGLLGDELHARVAKAMPSGMPPLAMFDRMKPWLIQFLLIKTLVDEHQKEQAAQAKDDGEEADGAAPGQGLDPLLYTQAKEAGKQVGGLETIRTQINVFDTLSFETQVEMVAGMCKQIEKFRGGEDDEDGEDAAAGNEMTRMVDMWLAGDDQGFLKIFEDELKKQGGSEAKKFVEGLLDNRNVNMVKKIQELMKAHPDKTFFMAVGAGHMPGKMGMVNLMREAGFKVQRMELGATLPTLPAKPEAAKETEPAKEPAGAGK